MQALGYERYGVSGGDIGAGVAEQLCIQAGDRVIGSLVVTDPGAIATEYTPPTDHLTEAEQERHQALKAARAEDFGYIAAPDDPAAVDRLRPHRLAGRPADLDRREVPGVDRPDEGAARGRGRPRPAADAGERLLVRRGGAGAANFLYEAAHAAAAWGQTHDRPQGFVAFGDEPLIRRILDPADDAAVLERARARRPLPGDGGAGRAGRRPPGVLRGLRS